MPHSPKRPCRWTMCDRLSNEPYCEEHRKRVDSNYNRYQRDSASKKRYGHAWQKIRARKIKIDPLCEICRREQRVTVAEQVHHIKPLSEGGGNDMSNLMSLCASCHSRVTLAATKKSTAINR